MDNFDLNESTPATVPAQRTDGWHAQRCGRITASRIKDVMAVSKRDGKPLQARSDYLTEIVCEILTGQPAQKYQNAAMAWGVECEPLALGAYQRATGREIVAAGFCLHPTLEYVGASPDGLMLDRGLEIKAPFNTANHIAAILDGMPPDHMAQVQAGMWICELPEWDFVSYDKRLSDGLDLYVQTIPRDDIFIATMAAECAKFWDEACELVARLKDKARAMDILRDQREAA